MKKFRLLCIMLLFIAINMSCSENERLIEDDFSYKFDIESIEAFIGEIGMYEAKYYGLLKSQGYEPDFTNSQVVKYKNIDVKAIFTPLDKSLLNSDSNSMLIFFELNNQLLEFDLIITEAIINNEIGRYWYHTLNGDMIVQFDVQLQDGLVLEVITLKSWGNRWSNCVEWTLNQMSYLDYLACMAVGPYCAGGISAMCAVAASEGMFQSPLGP